MEAGFSPSNTGVRVERHGHTKWHPAGFGNGPIRSLNRNNSIFMERGPRPKGGDAASFPNVHGPLAILHRRQLDLEATGHGQYRGQWHFIIPWIRCFSGW